MYAEQAYDVHILFKGGVFLTRSAVVSAVVVFTESAVDCYLFSGSMQSLCTRLADAEIESVLRSDSVKNRIRTIAHMVHPLSFVSKSCMY